MSSLSPPKAPPVTPYTDVVAQQTAASQAAAQGTQKLNAIDQNTPINNLSYTYDPTTGQYTATNQYSPQQQQLLDYLQQTQTVAGQQGQSLLSGAAYGASQPNISGDANSQTQQLIAQQMQQLRPEQDYQTSNLDTKLRNQGLTPGTEEYDNQMREFQANLANNNAANAATFEGQAYGQALQNYQLPAAMAQSLAGFGSPQSSIASMWNTPTTQINPASVTDAYNAQNTAAMNAFKAKSDLYGGLVSGIGKTALAVGAAPVTGGLSLGALPGIFGQSGSVIPGSGSMGAAG